MDIKLHNEETYQFLRTTTVIHLQELKQEEKRTQAVLLRFPLSMNEEHLVGGNGILQATRMRTRAGQITNSILLTFSGPAPSSINLAPFGTFLTRSYNPEPMRCFNCQRFGRHKAQCRSAARCGVCSGRHETSQCLQKHKSGQATTARCPNCQQAHHAWNSRCPERLRRVQDS